MTADEVQILIDLAYGHTKSIQCDSFNDVRRVRTWMKEHYPHIEVRARSNERTGKVSVKVKVRPP